MLALILITKFTWQPGWQLARYDFLFLAALTIQILFLLTKLETIDEVKVIFIFHVVGTVMEIFKTDMGSWLYPENNILRIGGVPLFSGFMYSCVGSYIARASRVLHLRYSNYPLFTSTVVLCGLIYANFFTHHYIIDLRYILFVLTFLIFLKTRVYYRVYKEQRWMPLLLGFFLISFFIWLAENIGTFAGAWVYPHQKHWQMVHVEKMGSWFLLIIISFVLVTLVHKPEAANDQPVNNN